VRGRKGEFRGRAARIPDADRTAGRRGTGRGGAAQRGWSGWMGTQRLRARREHGAVCLGRLVALLNSNKL